MTLKSRVKQLEDRFGFVSPTETQPPDIVISWVAPVRDGAGKKTNHILGGVRCDPHSAECNGKTFERLPSESVDDFTDRIIKSERKGLPVMVVMSAD